MKEKSFAGISVMLGMPSWGLRGEVAVERDGERTRSDWGAMETVLTARGLRAGQRELRMKMGGGGVLVGFSVEGPPSGSARDGNWACQ
jgi:hypothetical protein